jgi:hypothetical protein
MNAAAINCRAAALLANLPSGLRMTLVDAADEIERLQRELDRWGNACDDCRRQMGWPAL